MRLTLLGTGTTSGIPAEACLCPACTNARTGRGPRRRFTCAWIEGASNAGESFADKSFAVQIDAGLDGPRRPDVLLLTHFHPDHIATVATVAPGIPVWGPSDPDRLITVQDQVPELDFHVAEAFVPVRLANGWTATPVPLQHCITAFGWLVEGPRRIAWLTDTFGLPAATIAFLAHHHPTIAAIDTSFPPGDPRAAEKQHNDLPRAVASLADIACERGLLIHVGHHLQNHLDSGVALPPWCRVGHDGEVW